MGETCRPRIHYQTVLALHVPQVSWLHVLPSGELKKRKEEIAIFVLHEFDSLNNCEQDCVVARRT